MQTNSISQQIITSRDLLLLDLGYAAGKSGKDFLWVTDKYREIMSVRPDLIDGNSVVK